MPKFQSTESRTTKVEISRWSVLSILVAAIIAVSLIVTNPEFVEKVVRGGKSGAATTDTSGSTTTQTGLGNSTNSKHAPVVIDGNNNAVDARETTITQTGNIVNGDVETLNVGGSQ